MHNLRSGVLYSAQRLVVVALLFLVWITASHAGMRAPGELSATTVSAAAVPTLAQVILDGDDDDDDDDDAGDDDDDDDEEDD